jgi:hypothetical protein
MRTGVTLSITSADLERLRALVGDRNAPQKHVWRARIVLLSGEGLGTNAIMRETGKSKTCVWRWQERFAAEGSKAAARQDAALAHPETRHRHRRARCGADHGAAAGRGHALDRGTVRNLVCGAGLAIKL